MDPRPRARAGRPRARGGVESARPAPSLGTRAAVALGDGFRSPVPRVTRASGSPVPRVTRTSDAVATAHDGPSRPARAPAARSSSPGDPPDATTRLCTGAAPGRLRACGKRLWTKAVDNSERGDPPLRTVFHRLADPCGNWGSTMMSFVHTCGYRCGELWITLSTALSTTGDNRAVSALETSRARPHYPPPWGPP